jgi:hypothetical protein
MIGREAPPGRGALCRAAIAAVAIVVEPTRAERFTLRASTSNYPTAPRFVVIAVPAP